MQFNSLIPELDVSNLENGYLLRFFEHLGIR